MAEQNETLNRVIEVAKEWARKLPEAEVTESTDFFDDLGYDYLDMIELSIELEELFDLPDIPYHQLEEVKTVGEMVELIDKIKGTINTPT